MSTLIQKVLDIAHGEIGYLEKETYDQLDSATANAGDENYTKDQRDLAKISYFNSSKKGIAWCAVFVCWCLVQVVGETLAKALLCQPERDNCGAGCNSQMNYYKKKGCWHTKDPRPGDQIIFWNSAKTEGSHTGWVYKVDNTYVYTVEGNTSGASGVIANGGGVCAKKYKLGNSRIAGYGRPRWELATDTPTPPTTQPDTAPTPDAPEQSTYSAWVHVASGSTVNFRTAPKTSAKRVSGMTRIKQGEQVLVKSSNAGWASVEYCGYSGYVMEKYLTTKEPEQQIVQESISSSPTTGELRTYVTKQGDTLWKISKEFYGAGNKYKRIMEANSMKSTVVRTGMILVIPEG